MQLPHIVLGAWPFLPISPSFSSSLSSVQNLEFIILPTFLKKKNEKGIKKKFLEEEGDDDLIFPGEENMVRTNL